MNGSFGSPVEKFSINFTKANTTFCFNLHYNDEFNGTESRKVSLNGNVYDFSVDYNFIDKSDMLNIHKYLMTNNIIK